MHSSNLYPVFTYICAAAADILSSPPVPCRAPLSISCPLGLLTTPVQGAGAGRRGWHPQGTSLQGDRKRQQAEPRSFSKCISHSSSLQDDTGFSGSKAARLSTQTAPPVNLRGADCTCLVETRGRSQSCWQVKGPPSCAAWLRLSASRGKFPSQLLLAPH